MKEKRTYKRFDLPSFLALAGCTAVLLFECVFIFERYELFLLTGGAPSIRPAPVAEPMPVAPPQESSPASNAPVEPVQSPPVG